MVEVQHNVDGEERAAEFPRRTPPSLPGIWGQRWVRVIAYMIIAGVAVMVAIPIAMKHYLQNWLVDNGADEAVIRNIDFNPFVGSVRLEDLGVKIAGRTVMGNVDIHVDVGLTALLNRTITVESATLDNFQLEIERLDGGRLRVGSLMLGDPDQIKPAVSKALKANDAVMAKATQPATEPSATAKATPKETGKSWFINLRQLRMSNSEIRYRSPELNATLAVMSASVERVYTGFSNERGAIKLQASLDGAPVALDVVLNINSGLTLHGTVRVDGLQLEPLKGLIKEQAQELGGVVNLDGDVTFTDGREQPMSAKYNGRGSLADIVFRNKDLSVSGQTISWNGAITVAADQSARVIGLDGTLEGGGLGLQMPAQQLNLKQSSIKLSGRSDVTLGASPAAKFNGAIALSGTDLGGSELQATNDAISWDGAVEFLLGPGAEPDIKLDGSLTGSGLRLGLTTRQMSLAQSKFSAEGRTHVQIGNAMRASYTGIVALDGHQLQAPRFVVDGTSFAWNGTTAFMDNGDAVQTIDLEGKLSLTGLSAELPEQAIHATQGKIGMEARRIKLTLTPDHVDISGNATLNAADTDVKNSENGARLLSLAGLVVHDVELQSSKQFTVPSIKLSGLAAGNPRSPDMRLKLDDLALETVRVTGLIDLSVGQVRTTKLQVVDQTKDIVLAQLSDVGITAVTTSGAQRVSAEAISLGEVTLLAKLTEPEVPPLGLIGKTQVSGVTVTPDGMTVDAVKINSVQANIIRTQGSEAADTQRAKSTAVPEVATDDKDDTKVQDAQIVNGTEDGNDFKFDIGTLELAGDSLIIFEDRTVTPTFRTPLRISTLKLKTRDREQTFGPMDITMSGALGEYAVIKADGMADPSARAIDIKLELADANMIVLTPYTLRRIGYTVDSGHLSLDASIRIANGRIDSQNKLFLRELYMEKASEELAAEAEAEVGMSIEKAMDMLRDKQGNIGMDVPISGALSDLKVGLGDAIGKALRSALKSSTIAYLKFVNPTYGVGVTVIEKVKEQIQKIRIGPIEYEVGRSDLPTTAAKYLAETAAKLKKNTKLDVRVCPYATNKDLAAVAGKSLNEVVRKEMIDKVVQLGHDRAAGIKQELITRHDVAPGRVIICVTKYDKKEGAKPRVKLLF